jgi:hypothetical protein
MQSTALAPRFICIVEETALAVYTIYKYYHANEEHFACCAKWRRTIRSIAYTCRGIFCAGNFFHETGFWLEA